MWKKVKLGEICELNLGKTPHRNNKKYWDKEKITSNVWLSIADLNSSIENYIGDSKEYISDAGTSLSKPVTKGTLLMSFKLTIGRLAFANRDLWTNEAIVALPIKKDENLIIKEFLYYALSSINWHKLTKDDVKIKGKTLNKKKLAVIEIPLPPLAEQKRIVDKLDKAFAEIDSAIITTEHKQKEIEKFKKAVLSNKLTKLANLEITKGYKNIKIEDLFEVSSSKRILKSQWKSKGIPFYRGREITSLSKYGSVNNQLFISNEVYKKYAAKYGIPKENDILITAIGTIGSTYIVKANEKFYFKDGSVLWLDNKGLIDSEYTNYWLKTDEFLKQLDKGNGATVDTLTINKLRSIELLLPPLAEQKRIVAKLDNIFKQADMIIANTQKQLSEYQSLKTSILASELQSKVA